MASRNPGVIRRFLRALLEGLRRDLGLSLSPVTKTYALDEETATLLREIAEKEQRSDDEVANELLSYAVRQRYFASEALKIWNDLTPREQQVVALVCHGLSYPQIAELLSISRETVKSHLYKALGKFGLRSKSDLLRLMRDWDFSEWLQNMRG